MRNYISFKKKNNKKIDQYFSTSNSTATPQSSTPSTQQQSESETRDSHTHSSSSLSDSDEGGGDHYDHDHQNIHSRSRQSHLHAHGGSDSETEGSSRRRSSFTPTHVNTATTTANTVSIDSESPLEPEVSESGPVPTISLCETDNEDTPPRPKRAKLQAGRSGASNYLTAFNPNWVKKYDHIAEIPGDKHHFRCLAGQKTNSCGHMGEGDVKRHINSNHHQSCLRNESNSRSSQLKLTDNGSQSIIAELRAANLIVQGNCSISFSDKLSEFVQMNFHHDPRAKAFTAGRTKMTALISALADDCRCEIVEKMKVEPYAIFTDGSNDNGIEKMLPVTVNVFDLDSPSLISQRFLDMGMSASSTAQVDTGKNSLNKKLERDLNKHEIPLSNCVALGVDNTNANVGAHHSLKSLLTADNPSILVVGCVCHILHNGASKGCQKLQELGVDVEDWVMDIYNHFKNSSPRKQELKDFCDFVEVEYVCVLKHVRTRWLSLVRVIKRTLELYEALKSYFISCDLKDEKSKWLKKVFSDPSTPVYLDAIHSFSSILNTTNLQLQKGDPQIHRLLPPCRETVTTCMRRFCRSVDEHLQELDLENVPRRQGREVRIGTSAKTRLTRLLSAEEMTERQVDAVYENIAIYMEVVVRYLLTNLPLDDSFLHTLRWIDPSAFCGGDADSEGIMECAMRYRKIFTYTDIQVDELEDMVESAMQSQLVKSLNQENVVDVWKQVGLLMGGRYKVLSNLALCLLLIPHSNAAAERVFSLINLNLTPNRKCLSKDTTLNNIMLIKCSNLKADFSPPGKLQKAAKRATRLSLLKE